MFPEKFRERNSFPVPRDVPLEHLLHKSHQSFIVLIRPIEFELRELRIVIAVNAFVPEHLADLEHLLETAHEEPLEVKFGRDAQIKILAQCVVMGFKRLCSGAAGDRLEYRRFHFEKSLRAQKAAQVAYDLRARLEKPALFAVQREIKITAAHPFLRIFETVPVGWQGPERFCGDPRALRAHALLAFLGFEEHPFRRNKIPDVERCLEFRKVGKPLLLEHELDIARSVPKIGKDDVALVAETVDAANDGDGPFEERKHAEPFLAFGNGMRAAHPRRIGVRESFELVFALLPQVVEHGYAFYYRPSLPALLPIKSTPDCC